MEKHFDEFEYEELINEIKKLSLENKKLNRQLNLANDNMKKYKSVTIAKENLNAVISTEKQKQDKQLQVIMDNSPNIFILLDRAMNFMLSTQSFLDLAGIPGLGFLHHKSFRQVFSSFSSDDWIARMEERFKKAFETNEALSFDEKLCIGAAGKVRNYAVSVIPFIYSVDKSDGLLVSFHDMTERIEMEDKLKEALNDAMAASKAKSDFLANMSHEIRTPMNAIIGMTELTLREELSEKVLDHTNTIKQAGEHLLRIINDILDFSKIEMGKLEIVPSDYLLSSLLNDVISIIRMRMVDKRLLFTVNINSKLPNALHGDEIRIRQILINLLGNAVKYTEQGFVSMIVSGEIEDKSKVSLKFQVKDSGFGIKKDNLNKLFNGFAQLDADKQRGIEGTGLGLAITKDLVKAMNGEITVESEYGKGSVFSVTLQQDIRDNERIAAVNEPDNKRILVYEPRRIYADSIVSTIENLGVFCTLAISEEEFFHEIDKNSFDFIFISSELLENAKERLPDIKRFAEIVILTGFGETTSDSSLSAMAMPVTSISVANILNGSSDSFVYGAEREKIIRFIAPQARVLVVDDINTNLKVTGGLMLPYKMEVDFCMSGMEAINAVKSKQYDLILMDQMMPQMDGLEAMRRIRALAKDDPQIKSMPIVALTANAVLGTKEKLLSSGFDDYLSKPINTIWLNTILETWIPKKKQLRVEAAISTNEGKHGNGKKMMIKGIDANKGISISGGFIPYLETLKVFYEDGIEKIADIETCRDTDNLKLYTIYVHALKSALANIGDDALSEIAKSLEMAGEKGDLDFINKNTGSFIKELKSLLHHIKSAITAQSEVNDSSFDEPVYKEDLIRLKDALNHLCANEMNKITDRLLNLKKPKKQDADIRCLSKLILLCEYDEAVALIDRLI